MTDQARTPQPPSETRPEKIVHFSRERIADGTSTPEPKRDWSAAIDLVNETYAAIRMADERVASAEAYADRITAQFNEQLKTADARFAAMEKRAELAEARLRESETWLNRFHDTIVNGFQESLGDRAVPQKGASPAFP